MYRIQKSDNGETANYSYTYDDLLAQVDGPNGAMTGYGYDAFNRRIYTTDQDGNTTAYLYDGLDVLQEVTGQNDQKIATYYRVNGTILTRQEFNVSQDDTALYQNRPTGRQLYYSYDGLGSTAALTDHNGRLVTSYQYDAYGQLTGGDIKENTYTFTGKRFDEESGLYHFHFRKYDPVVGVWTTEDPIGVLGGVNVYGYVGNDPVLMIDLYGLYSFNDVNRFFESSKVRAISSLGASMLADYAASNMEPSIARGTVYLAASALAITSAADAALASAGSYIFAVDIAPTIVGSVAASTVGIGFAGLAIYDYNLAVNYGQLAYGDFVSEINGIKIDK